MRLVHQSHGFLHVLFVAAQRTCERRCQGMVRGIIHILHHPVDELHNLSSVEPFSPYMASRNKQNQYAAPNKLAAGELRRFVILLDLDTCTNVLPGVLLVQ